MLSLLIKFLQNFTFTIKFKYLLSKFHILTFQAIYFQLIVFLAINQLTNFDPTSHLINLLHFLTIDINLFLHLTYLLTLFLDQNMNFFQLFLSIIDLLLQNLYILFIYFKSHIFLNQFFWFFLMWRWFLFLLLPSIYF